MTVHVVTKQLNSPYPEDIDLEIVKVFKGTRIRAANKWAQEQESECKLEYRFFVHTWEVE